MKIKNEKPARICLKTGNGRRRFKWAGNENKFRMNLLKYSLTKLIILTCASLLHNELVPDGWKNTSNYNKNNKN